MVRWPNQSRQLEVIIQTLDRIELNKQKDEIFCSWFIPERAYGRILTMKSFKLANLS